MKKLVSLIGIICFITTLSLSAAPKEAPTSKIGSSYAKSLSRPFIDVSKKAIPAVVFIRAESVADTSERHDAQDLFGDDFFRRFFGAPPQDQQKKSPTKVNQGSGFFISSDGYIITNYHVVKDAKNIIVSRQNGMERELPAIFIGGDSHTDVAVIKVDIENSNFPHLNFGNSDEMEVGEWVVAIGSPFELEASVTVGVISATGRQGLQISNLEDFIQTDAAINPGNSGGPLLNLDGEVIGINTAILSHTGAYMGIGFAIPSLIAKNITNQLIEKGRVTRGFLGVSLQSIDKDLAESFNLKTTEGALVADVVKGSAADKAGIKQGDIITKVNKIPVKSPASLYKEIFLLEPGTRIILTINRKGKTFTLPATIGAHTKDLASASTVSQKLGIVVDNLTPENITRFRLSPDDTGVVITEVKPGSLGTKMGLRPGYIILGVNHKKITNVSEFLDALEDIGDSKRILLLVRHGEIMRFHSIKVE